MGNRPIFQPVGIDADDFVFPVDFSTQKFQYLEHGGNIPEPRHVFENSVAPAKYRCGEQRQRGIFRSADPHLALERSAALDTILDMGFGLLSWGSHLFGCLAYQVSGNDCSFFLRTHGKPATWL